MNKMLTLFGIAAITSMSFTLSTTLAVSTADLIRQHAKKPPSSAILAALKTSRYRPYSKIKYSLKKRTHIPILLPSADTVDQYIFANTLTKSSIAFAKPSAYLIYFQWSKVCNGAPICTSASVYGARINNTMPFNSSQAPSDKAGKKIPVMLDKNLMGELTPLQTEKTASPFRSLSWNEGGVRYVLSLKQQAKVSEFTAIANSMINNQLN